MTKWANEAGILYPVEYEIKMLEKLEVGVYEITMSNNPLDKRLGLKWICEKFTFNFKIYDLEIDETIKHVTATWNSEYFKSLEKNLGIIFNGLKGTGKTIGAKILSNKMNLPVIIVPQAFQGLSSFIQNINFECVVLIDEAEKLFPRDSDESLDLLKIMDGIVKNSRKLFILTSNHLHMGENLLGRPGRVRYLKNFRNLSENSVREYITDNLINKSNTERLIELLNKMEFVSIDIVKSLVDEFNIHNEIKSFEELNLPILRARYQCYYLSNCESDLDLDDSEEIDLESSPTKMFIKIIKYLLNKYESIGNILQTTISKEDLEMSEISTYILKFSKNPLVDINSLVDEKKMWSSIFCGGITSISLSKTEIDCIGPLCKGTSTNWGEIMELNPYDIPNSIFISTNSRNKADYILLIDSELKNRGRY